MVRTRSQFIALLVGVALAAAGCQLPFEREVASHRVAKPQAESAVAEETAAGKDRSASISAVTAAADDATLASVMQEVEQIGATNPAAQQALLAELRRSRPNLWPLVVRQFKSTMAYHDQLQAKPAAAADRPSDVDAQMSAVPYSNPATTTTSANDPPSASFGKLTDPRSARQDPAVEKLLAAATPGNMPAPSDSELMALAANAPRAFMEVVEAQPLARQSAEIDRQVLPASATESTTATTNHGVQPALYSVEATPVAKAGAHDWREHLQLAIDDLGRQVSHGPQSTAEVHRFASLRMMQLLAGKTENALEPIPKISAQEQDYWSGQIFALATFLDHHTQPDDKRRAAASVVHLDEAVGHLREMGSLSLRNLAFCDKVYGYGAYEEIQNPKFTPGQQASLYIEVENYHSESTEKGYSTLLAASYEILDSAGKRVSGGEFPPVEDYCRSRRRDFHIQYGLVLPKNLAPGRYRLALAMKDRQSDKLGHASIDFEIGGQ